MANSDTEPIRRRAGSNCTYMSQSVASNGVVASRGELGTQKAASTRRLSLVQRNSSFDVQEDYRIALSSSEHRSLLCDAQNGSANNAEYERVESWLDEHPDFVADYFVRKANYRHVSAWLDRRGASGNLVDETWTRSNLSEGASDSNTNSFYTVKAYRADEPVKLTKSTDSSHLRAAMRHSISTISAPSRKISLCSSGDRPPRKSEERFACANGDLNGLGLHNVSHSVRSPLAVEKAATDSATERASDKQCETDENSRFLCDLLVDLSSTNDDVTRMSHRVALAICQLLGCECATLFTVSNVGNGDANEEQEPVRLVCRVANVGPSHDGASQPHVTVRAGPQGGLVGMVAQSGEPLRVDDAYADERFNRELDATTNYQSRSLLLMPIKTRTGELIGVAVATNKQMSTTNTENDSAGGRRASNGQCQKAVGQAGAFNARKNSQPELNCAKNECYDCAAQEGGKRKQEPTEAIHPRKYSRSERYCVPFSAEDQNSLGRFVAVCALALRNAALLEKLKQENTRSETLLELAGCIFREQVDLHALIYKIMMYAQNISRCERCQLLLIDDASANHNADSKMGMFSQVYDLSTDCPEPTSSSDSDSPRFPISLAVSEFVASTGETINTADLERDPRFASANGHQSPGTASPTCSRSVRSVLCMPIKNGQDEVIGVCVLANKLGEGDAAFERDDERFFEAFTLFCGLGIHQTKMYERAIRAVAKQRVALEVLSYHATASVEEAQRLRKMNIPTSRFYQLYDFGFCDFSLTDDDTLKCALRMFIDLRLVETFRVDYGVLCRFLLSVKKNYRNVTYHNWRHALNVTQSMFAMISKAGEKLSSTLSELEKLGLLVACLCHDLDHRGTNNQFQIKSASALAQLYSTSVMEHHHFDQACMLLQAKGNELFQNLSREQHDSVLSIIEKAILATDLALYFKYREGFFRLVGRSPPHTPTSESAPSASITDWHAEGNRSLLRSMLMTACDLSAIYKPWDVQKRVAELVFGEFFEQGDIERSELNLEPDDMMNRHKKDLLPAMQVGYIDAICMPLYDAFALFHDAFAPLRDACLRNRLNWQALAEVRSQRERELQNAACAGPAD